MPETALICRVPEAERYIARYRERYRSVRAAQRARARDRAVPVHAAADIDDAVTGAARRHRARGARASITGLRKRGVSRGVVSRAGAGRFLRGAHRGDFRAFPDYPPFEGKFPTVVPHVTVAHGDEPQLCEIEVELRIALPPGGGIKARCSEMILIENSSGALGRDAELRAGVEIRHQSRAPGDGAQSAARASVRNMIRKLAGKFRLYSRKSNPKTGKRRNLGTFATRAAAEKHERAVQYFKRH